MRQSGLLRDVPPRVRHGAHAERRRRPERQPPVVHGAIQVLDGLDKLRGAVAALPAALRNARRRWVVSRNHDHVLETQQRGAHQMAMDGQPVHVPCGDGEHDLPAEALLDGVGCHGRVRAYGAAGAVGHRQEIGVQAARAVQQRRVRPARWREVADEHRPAVALALQDRGHGRPRGTTIAQLISPILQAPARGAQCEGRRPGLRTMGHCPTPAPLYSRPWGVLQYHAAEGSPTGPLSVFALWRGAVPGRENYLTREGLVRLEAELEEYRTVRRQRVAERIQKATELGGTVDNAEYDDSKNEQAFVEGRILTLERITGSVIIIGGDAAHSGEVQMGGRVTLLNQNGAEEEYTIVGSPEAAPAQGRISNESPVGKALLKKRVGDEVQVNTPAGTVTLTISSIS